MIVEMVVTSNVMITDRCWVDIHVPSGAKLSIDELRSLVFRLLSDSSYVASHPYNLVVEY